MAQEPVFRAHMIEQGCVTALVSVVISGRWVSAAFALRVCQIFCFFSFCSEQTERMVFESRIMIAFHTLYRSHLCTPKAACMISIVVRNLSAHNSSVRKALIEQNCIALIGEIFADILVDPQAEYEFIRPCLLPLLYHLCLETDLHGELVKQGLLRLLIGLTVGSTDMDDTGSDHGSEDYDHEFEENNHTKTKHRRFKCDERCQANVDALSGHDIHFVTSSANSLALTESCLGPLLKSSLVRVLGLLVRHRELLDVSRHEIACILCRLSCDKNIEHKKQLMSEGAAEVLAAIALATQRQDTQTQCSLALGYLSSVTRVGEGVVESLLMLTLLNETKISVEQGGSRIQTADPLAVSRNGPRPDPRTDSRVDGSSDGRRTLKSAISEGLRQTRCSSFFLSTTFMIVICSPSWPNKALNTSLINFFIVVLRRAARQR
jgi:hypothetical protein